jgi:serine/threonine-protein kinase
VTSTWGEYVIVEELGRGSFGAVFKAYHPTLRQHVALKLIAATAGNEREIERALEEPRRLASVRHQNVVIVHDARYADGHVGICMELISGESLAQVVQRRGRLGPEEVTAYAINLCRALSAIHRAEIVHNDVKAQNVMREDGGRIVLMDFGAGRRLSDPDRTTGLYMAGTPVYMAPELFQFRDPGRPSDIYSLGVLMFYLLTGTFPVEGATLQDVAKAHSRGERRYLGDLRDDIPERLLAVVDRSLSPSPKDRYKTSGEMLHDLVEGEPWKQTRRRRHAHPPAGGDRSEDVQKRFPARVPSRSLRDRTWTNAIAVIAPIPAIWLIGFLGSRAHGVMFGITREFDVPSPLDWLVIGFRSLPLPIFCAIAAATLYVVVAMVWRILTRLSTRTQRWSSGMFTRIAAAGTSAGLSEPRTTGAIILTLQVVLLGAVYWGFNDLIMALTTPLQEGPIQAHARLAPVYDYVWLLFCAVNSILAFVSAVTWGWMARHRRQEGPAAIGAGFAVAAVFAALATVPWQVVYGADFRVASFESERCYVVEENRSEVALLLCPWRETGRTVVVRTSDPKLQLGDESENVFAAVAERLQPSGGSN